MLSFTQLGFTRAAFLFQQGAVFCCPSRGPIGPIRARGAGKNNETPSQRESTPLGQPGFFGGKSPWTALPGDTVFNRCIYAVKKKCRPSTGVQASSACYALSSSQYVLDHLPD